MRAVVFSPYSQVALLITVACSGLWWSGPGSSAIVLQVLPNLLGFSIGAFAILVAAVQGRLGGLLLEKRGDGAPLVDAVASTFVHFIVVQGIALIMAVLGSSGIGAMMTSLLSSVSAGSFLTWSVYIVAKAFRLLAFYAFAYSLMLVIAAAFGLFRTLGWEALAYEAEKEAKKRVPPVPAVRTSGTIS